MQARALTRGLYVLLQVVLRLPVANCTMANRHVFFIMANRHEMHEALHHSLDYRADRYVSEFSSFSMLVGCWGTR